MRISDWSSDVCSSDLKTPRIDDYKARYERPKPCQPVLAIDAVKTRTTLPGALHPLCRAQTQCRPPRALVFRYRPASRGIRRHMAAVHGRRHLRVSDMRDKSTDRSDPPHSNTRD